MLLGDLSYINILHQMWDELLCGVAYAVIFPVLHHSLGSHNRRTSGGGWTSKSTHCRMSRHDVLYGWGEGLAVSVIFWSLPHDW